jgi:transposase
MSVAVDPVEVIVVLAAEEPVITLVARDVVVAGEATNPVCRWRAGQPVIIRCAGDLLGCCRVHDRKVGQHHHSAEYDSKLSVRVLAGLRRFLREGTPWRSLRATSVQASGSTLRRRLAGWAEINLLQRVHAMLVAMLCGDPDLILDSCSVRAKRGGDLTGPNPTDRGKRGTKYHVAVTGDGVPVACAATGANVNDTVLFERLFLMAFAVVAKIGTVFADKGYDAEGNRETCRAFGAEPQLHKRGRPHGSGLGKRRWPVERSNAWLLENRRLALRYDRQGFIVQSLLQAACLFLVAGRLAREL